MVSTVVIADQPAEARSSRKSSSKKKHSSSKKSSSKRHKSASKSRHKSSRHRSSKSKHRHHHKAAARAPRYAYPYDFFMMNAPDFDRSPLPESMSADVMREFVRGQAGHRPAATMVRAGVFKYHPLKGGIFFRREPIKYIIMHSTETGNPNMDAPRVINSWNSRGRRHPGAQFVVDRDGTIYQAVDPDLGTVHINIFKTIAGVNNDNCIGIEMVHSGSQDYPPALVVSAVRLVNYLQERYGIPDENVTTHRYVQQGDHTDPVRFDWTGFILKKNKLRTEAIAMKMDDIRRGTREWKTTPQPLPGERRVEGSIAGGEAEKQVVPPKEKGDVNLLDLDRVEPKKTVQEKAPEKAKPPTQLLLDLEEPKPPSTLLQLRGPILLEPEDAEKLNKVAPVK